MTRRTFWIILALGAIMRLLMIWQAELWYDENFSLILARLPLMHMLVATVGDVHPPLYYLVVWPLGQIANLPPWTLRLPSALFSILSLALYPRILRQLRVPDSVQLVAFGFMAFLPMQLHYAQEVRMYALLELLVVLGTIAVLEGRWLLLTLSVAGLLYTHNYGTFYVAALGNALLMVIYQQAERHRIAMADMYLCASDLGMESMRLLEPAEESLRSDLRRKWYRMAAALLIGMALWLPWLPTMLRQAAFIKDNYWIFDTSLGGISYEIFKLFWGLSLATPAGNVAGILLSFGLLILAVWYLLTRRPHAWQIIAALAFGPIVMAVAVSLTFQPLLLFRPLIGVTPFLYLACTYPLGSIATMRGRLYAACFILPVFVMGLRGYYALTPELKTSQGTGSMQAAVGFITDHWQPGDVVLHGSGLGWVSLAPYTDLPQFAIPNCTPKFPGSISPTTRDAIGIPAGDINHLPPHKRVWFTAVFSPMLPACQLAKMESIIADRTPIMVLSETRFLLSAVWLLED